MISSDRALASAGPATRHAGLDLVRAGAVLCVYIAHMGGQFADGRVGLALVYLGAVGVELFFSLSGFLIGRLLIRLAAEDIRTPAIGTFWLRRWLRTLPLYFVVLTVLSGWMGLWDWRAFLLVQNFSFQDRPQVLSVAWSLVLEEYFYTFFPLLLLALQLCTGWRGARLVASLCLGLIVVCSAVRLGANIAGLPGPDLSFRMHPLIRLDCAAWGVLAACLAENLPLMWRRRFERPWGVPVLALVLTVLLGALFVEAFDPWFVAVFHYESWKFLYLATVHGTMDAIFAGLILAVALQLPQISGWTGRVVIWVSTMSYAIYLVHVAIIQQMAQTGWGPIPRITATTLLVAGCAWLAHLLVERPFLAWRDRLTGPSRAPVQA